VRIKIRENPKAAAEPVMEVWLEEVGGKVYLKTTTTEGDFYLAEITEQGLGLIDWCRGSRLPVTDNVAVNGKNLVNVYSGRFP
jgi:hypothetical protein